MHKMALSEPIFQPIFGESWHELPLVMLKHYANHPYSDDVVTVEGTMDVTCKWYVKPFFKLMGMLPPHNAKNVSVTVHFSSQPDSNAFCFNRIFYFNKQKPYHFHSRMIQIKENEVAEEMASGIRWHCYYGWDGEKVTLRHKGYSFKLLGKAVMLPVTWLVGKGEADEIPLDDNCFAMRAAIIHPLLGMLYEYKGQFEVIKEQ